MSNARFTILQAKAVTDKRISNAQFRTLAALGMYGDKEGWCFPKLKTLATILGKTKQAVNHDLLELQKLGYVEIYHQYREDGGLQHNRYRLVFDTPYQADVDTPSTPEIDSLSTPEIDSLSTPEIDALTPHINAPVNAPVELVPERKNIYRVYEEEIGSLTPILSDELDRIEKEYPEGWFEDAVREGKKSTTNISLKYVLAILKRWKAQGRRDLKPTVPPPGPKKDYEPVRLPNGEVVYQEVGQ